MKKQITFIIVLVILTSCKFTKGSSNLYYQPDIVDYGVRFYKGKDVSVYKISDEKVVYKKEEQTYIPEHPRHSTTFRVVGNPLIISSKRFDQLDVVSKRLEFFNLFKEKDSIFFITKNTDNTYDIQYVKEEIYDVN